METLKYCRTFWTRLGLCSTSYFGLFSSFVIIFTNGSLIGLSLVFVIVGQKTVPPIALSFAFMQIPAAIACGTSYILIVIQKRRTEEVIESIRGIVSGRCNEFNRNAYASGGRSIYFISKWVLLIYVCVCDLSLVLITFAYAIYDVARGEIDVTRWYNLIQIRWEQSTLVAFTIQMAQYMCNFKRSIFTREPLGPYFPCVHSTNHHRSDGHWFRLQHFASFNLLHLRCVVLSRPIWRFSSDQPCNRFEWRGNDQFSASGRSSVFGCHWPVSYLALMNVLFSVHGNILQIYKWHKENFVGGDFLSTVLRTDFPRGVLSSNGHGLG